MNYACAHDDDFDPDNPLGKPDVPDAVQQAIRTLIEWAGDDPQREGLLDTPKRVAKAWREYTKGYAEDPGLHLSRTFAEVGGYDEIVILRDIPFQSHCEHHMAPIIGRAWVAYIPKGRVVGISKLARVVNAYAKRLQIQEKMTAQIAGAIQDVLEPKGVAVVIEASHQCMTTRGIRKSGVSMVTSRMLGAFRNNESTRREFLIIRYDAEDGVDLKNGLERCYETFHPGDISSVTIHPSEGNLSFY